MIHWPEPDVGGSLEEAWATLVELQQEGKVRHLGGSNFEVAHIERAEAIAPLAALQPKYSLLAPEAERELLPAAAARDIGVIVYSPMASGLLSGSMTRARAEALPEDDWRRADEQFTEPGLTRSLRGGRRRARGRAPAGPPSRRDRDRLDAGQPGRDGGDRRLPARRPTSTAWPARRISCWRTGTSRSSTR